jgi:short subunit fatty acids transporter
MSIANALMVEDGKFVDAFGPAAPSTAVPKWVSLKNYNRITILLSGLSDSTGGASAIALQQATAVAGTSAKALAFTLQYANIDTATSDTFVATTVASNTFNTTAVASKSFQYVIEIQASALDVTNGFDCMQVTIGDQSHAVISAIYYLRDPRFADASPPSAIVN